MIGFGKSLLETRLQYKISLSLEGFSISGSDRPYVTYELVTVVFELKRPSRGAAVEYSIAILLYYLSELFKSYQGQGFFT